MSDHRRREESTPLVPPRSLGSQPSRDSSSNSDDRGGRAPWSGRSGTQTQEQPAQSSTGAGESTSSRSGPTNSRSAQPTRSEPRSEPPPRSRQDAPDESDTEKTSPLAVAAAAVAAAKERAIGPSPRPEGMSRSEDQLRAASAARPGRTRRARLRLVRLDPWSVMKTSFLLSIAFGIMCVVAVFIIWSVLGAANVFGSINGSVESVVGDNFAIEDYIGMDRVLSFTMLVAVLDVVLITAIATLGAFLYNLAASLLGGLEVTLAEDDH